MKIKLPKYLYGSWLLSLTLLLAIPVPVLAQSEMKTDVQTERTEQQLPAAYYNSSWTVVAERTNGTGEVSGNAIDPSNFTIPNTGVAHAPESTQATVVYDNGPHINQPGNPDVSLLEVLTLGMSSLGGNVSHEDFAVADDFELVAETEITGITAYAYQTGATSTSINAMYVTIWDGDPSGGGSIVWGDQTTNVFDSVEDINAYRASEDSPGDQSRMLQKVNASISGLTLDAGTYWLEYSLAGTEASGPWQPPIVILGETTTGDALQRLPTGWQPWLDIGSNTPQGVPFQIEGVEAGGGTFPSPYCGITNGDDIIVHKITNVDFAGTSITNEDDTSPLLDKTDVVVDVTESETYTLVVEDNAQENYQSKVVAFIDWNQNGVLDDSGEIFEVGILEFPTRSASIDVTIPADAVLGETRIRIVKTYFNDFSAAVINPCAIEFEQSTGVYPSLGQALDFTLNVEEGGGGGHVYCIPEGTNSGRYIDNFSTTGGTQDVSNMGSGFSPDGYGDFYDTHTLAQAQGEDVTFEVDIEGGTAGFRAWVDWNQDGVFDTTEEVAYQSDGYSTDHTGTITVPADALEGDTRMRIVSHWLSTSGDVDPCETDFSYGEFEDYKFTVEEGTGGGGSGEACEQDFAFSLDDGTGDVKDLLFAEDFEIGADDTMSVEEVTFRMFNNIGEATTIAFYEDDGGIPGGLVETFNNVAPDSQTFIGENYGMDAYDLAFTLPSAVDLDEGIYWVALQVTEGTDGGTNFWVITDDGVHSPGHYTDDGGVTWVQNSSGYDFSFKIEGECTSGGGGGGGFVCDDQFNASNAIENGLFFGGTTNQRMAVDVIVGDDGFTAYGSNLNVFLAAGQTTDDVIFDFIFYDDAGAPGNEVHSSSGTVHSTEYVGENFGYDVYTFEVEFDDAADFDANSTYWMEVESNGEAWETSTVGSFGSKMAFNNDNTGGDWNIDSTNDAVYSLICEEFGGGGGTACEQVFFDEDQPTGVGFADGNMVANDVTVAAGESFTMETMTFDVVNLNGEPTEFDLEIFEDNGSGGVGDSTGDVYQFDSSNMTYVENGLFGAYTQYTVTLDLPNIELTADGAEDARYWLAIASELSTTGDFTYWVSYNYTTNPDSYPSWQYNTDDGWFEYEDAGGLTKEGIMTVSGQCESGGGTGDPCDAVDVPYVQDFETATPPDLPECTTVVNAGNGNNWKTSTNEEGEFTGTFLEYEYHANAANSWFFTQGINLEEGTEYEITYGYGSRAAAAFPENLKVAFGDDNDPDAMTNQIAEHVGILSGGDKIMNTVEFTAATSGVYYFGFQAFSDADQWFLYLDDIEIKEAGGGGGSSDCIATIYDGGNNGSPGGAVYFDITVGGEDIELTSIDLNTDGVGTSFTVDVYTLEGTYVGNATNQGAWTMQTQGSGTSAGEGNPSSATLDDTFTLSANTTYGMALVMDGSHSHYYTNGDGANEHFENSDLALDLGAATNTPFDGTVFEPRVFNGGLCYNVGGGGDPGIYCEPELDCTDGDVITNVTFQEIDNTTECSPNGYGDYTHLVATVQSNGTYPIAVTVGDGWANESVSVWIDFDDSGTFDEDEFFYIGTGSDETLTGDIDIPAGQNDGEYRMRVRVAAVGSGTATWDMACDETQGFGETEDYTVEVDGVVGIEDQSNTVFTYYPNPTSGVVNITANKDISSVSVVNILGQQVIAQSSLDNGQVDLSALSTGTYMFRVMFEDGSLETFKVLKE